MLKHGSPKMISKVNKQINQNVYKLFGLPVCRNESFYHDMQSDEVMYQTTQGYRNPFNSRRPQYHASIDTRGNNGPLWRHNSYR